MGEDELAGLDWHYVEVSCSSMPKLEKAEDQQDWQYILQVVVPSCSAMPRLNGSGFRALESAVCSTTLTCSELMTCCSKVC